jgi:hypothetical protein
LAGHAVAPVRLLGPPEKEKLVEGYLLVVLWEEPAKLEENLLLRENACAGEVRSRVIVG